MPAWIHDRAQHIRKKNPGMPEGMSWAIATQQAHAAGKTPKGYGTAEGKKKAKKKYDKPKSEYTQTADPSSKSKTSSLAFLKGFSDELMKIAGMPTRTTDMVKKVSTARRDAMKTVLPTPHNTLPPPLATSAGTNS